MNGPAPRPRVICHMISTIDGRIVADRWPDIGEGRREYERKASTYAADAWMCDRITMEPFAGAIRGEDELARESAARPAAGAARGDFVAPGAHRTYAVAIDPRGRLLWSEGEIDGDHVVAILTDGVGDAYVAGLRERGVSYLLAGDPGGEVDLARALEKLAATFGIRTLLLEGGGRINGSMLHAGLVDEVSLLLAPIADGALDTASVFDVERAPGGKSATHRGRRLELIAVERRRGRALDPLPRPGRGARESSGGLTSSNSRLTHLPGRPGADRHGRRRPAPDGAAPTGRKRRENLLRSSRGPCRPAPARRTRAAQSAH